jgi:hypothetical protein
MASMKEKPKSGDVRANEAIRRNNPASTFRPPMRADGSFGGFSRSASG